MGDDVVTAYDTGAFGMRDPEGVAYEPASGHLFVVSRIDQQIAEVTNRGSLVRLYDISPAGLIAPGDITVAPASDGSSTTHLYVADRGIDNDVFPTENDGRIFEFALTQTTTNQAPVVANPGPNQLNVEDDPVSLRVVASDPEGSPLTYTATRPACRSTRRRA